MRGSCETAGHGYCLLRCPSVGSSPCVAVHLVQPLRLRVERLEVVVADRPRRRGPDRGPRSKPYPWPAVSHEPRIQQLFDDLQKGGYHPFHAPCGILLDEADRAKSTCIRCTWCDGYPCLVHAKSDAETIAVRPILDLPNVTLLVGRRGRAGSRPTRPAEP